MIVKHAQKGKYNPTYTSAIFYFEDTDTHFFLRSKKSSTNWMPKWSEIELILREMIAIEPPSERENKKQRLIRAIEHGMQSEIINE